MTELAATLGSSGNVSPTSRIRLLAVPIIVLVHITALLVVHPTAVLGYVYFYGLAIGLYRLLIGRNILNAAILYVFYASLVLTLYILQYVTYPPYIGFSGPTGVGTDDGFFYSQIADVPVLYDTYVANVTAFSRLLQVITVHPVTHPLDVLFYLAATTALIPPLAYKTALSLFQDHRIARLASILIAVCPFFLSNSLILVRDGTTAVLFMAALYAFLRQKYVRSALLTSALLYVRVASGLQAALVLFLAAAMQFFELRRVSRRLLYLATALTLGSIAVVVAFPYVSDYLVSKRIIGTGNIFRQWYVEGLVQGSSQFDGYGDSMFLRIYQQPPWIRIPLGFAYFFIYPVFVPNHIVVNGIVRPRMILETLSAVLFWFYIKYFVQAVVAGYRHGGRRVRFAILAYLLLILALSQVSIQFRHKVMVLPFFYTIVAYGYYHRTKAGSVLGLGLAWSVALAQIARLVMRVF